MAHKTYPTFYNVNATMNENVSRPYIVHGYQVIRKDTFVTMKTGSTLPTPHRFYQFSFVCFLMKEVEFAALDHKCHRQRWSSFWLVSAITRTWERKFYGELLIVWSREQVLLKEVIYLRKPVSFNISASLPHTYIQEVQNY